MVLKKLLVIFIVNTFLLVGTTQENKTLLYCDFCPQVYKKITYLNRHVHNKHQIDNNVHCALCDGQPVFTSLIELDKHHKESHPNSRYFCKVCYDGHTTIDGLQNHRRKCYIDVRAALINNAKKKFMIN